MDIPLTIAGAACLAMAVGHSAIGHKWVLPRLTADVVPATPFGPSQLTVGLLRVTWHIVSLFCLSFAAVLITLAGTDADPTTVVLRSIAGLFAAAAAMTTWIVGFRLDYLMRLPVPVVWVVIAIVCWTSS